MSSITVFLQTYTFYLKNKVSLLGGVLQYNFIRINWKRYIIFKTTYEVVTF